MVKIIGYHVRTNAQGKEFITLDLQGDLVMVQSLETGHFYATAKKCSITSTFKEETAKELVGQQIPGRIERVGCEAYDYTVEQTGEVITLAHRYEYFPDGVPAPVIEMHAAKDQLIGDFADIDPPFSLQIDPPKLTVKKGSREVAYLL